MNNLEGKLRCLELAEKVCLKLSERHEEKIVAMSDVFWQYVSQDQKTDVPVPAAKGGKGKKPGRQPREKPGQPDLFD